ncbi:MAG: DegT/DnrJ/EryC1/StrS family aminotransferase [bacterium]
MLQTRPATIPLFNLELQHRALQKEINTAAVRVLESGKFILGPETGAFEKEFAQLTGVRHCISCSSGAGAIQISLAACGIGPGDEVITTPMTFLASASSISLTGAKFVLADVDRTTACLDPVQAEKKITSRTRAILPVHLYGYPAQMKAFMDLASRRNLKIVEDCAQSHLAGYDGKMTGSIGHAGAFSFYPSKNLGACGDAGAITTNDEDIALKCRQLRHNGRNLDKSYEHVLEGSTLRMHEVQAAILRVKLPHLAAWTEQRRKTAGLYERGLAGLPVKLPPTTGKGFSQSFYVYTIKAPGRDELAAHLKAAGIASGIYYPIPLYRQPVYAKLGYKPSDFPATEMLVSEVLSLPMFPEITAEQVERVCSEIKKFYKG